MVLVHKKSDNLSDHELICMAQSSSFFFREKRVFNFENIDPHGITKQLCFSYQYTFACFMWPVNVFMRSICLCIYVEILLYRKLHTLTIECVDGL